MSGLACRNTSPDLNPIEQVFAKFKTLLRKAGGAKLLSYLRRLRRNSPNTRLAECAAYLKNAGYA